MDEFLLSLRRLPMIILAALLVIPTGCLAPGEQMVNVSPEATASLASPTSAPVTAAPTLTTTPYGRFARRASHGSPGPGLYADRSERQRGVAKRPARPTGAPQFLDHLVTVLP